MCGKRRVSATVDAELVQAGQAAVAAGDAGSFSAWVNDALQHQADRDRRLRALDDFLEAYEAAVWADGAVIGWGGNGSYEGRDLRADGIALVP